MKSLCRLLFVALSLIAAAVVSTPASPLVDCAITLDRSVLPAGSEHTAVLKISLDVPNLPRDGGRAPINLALALDRSGSMSGEKIARAREAALAALDRLGPEDLFSLVVYDHSVETLVPPQSPANRDWIEARIRSITPGGNTALYGAVSQAAAEVRRNLRRGYIHRIVLLSDGQANVGPSSPQDLARFGAALIKEGISVSTVGIGDGYNEDLMSKLADRSDGNHYFAALSGDLPRIFAAELGDLLSVVARRVVIEIDCPDGVRPLRVIGRDGRIRGRRAEIHLNQLYGGQEKYALLEVAVAPGEVAESRTLATVRCSYENALTRSAEEARSIASVRFSQEEREVRRSASREVQKAVVENEIAEVREEALDLYNAGKKDEAVRQLKTRGAELSSRNEALGFSDLAAEAEALDADAASFAAPAPLAPSEKKLLRSESYKVRKQQKDY